MKNSEELVRAVFTNQKIRRWARSFIKNDGGSTEDVQDVFQDSALTLWENVQNGKEIDDTIGYFKGIIKNKWTYFDKKQKKRRTEELPEVEPAASISVDGQFIQNEINQIMNEEIQQMKEPCRTILHLYHKLGKSNEAIAEIIGMDKTADWVKSRKHKCRVEFLKKLKSRPDMQEYLKD